MNPADWRAFQKKDWNRYRAKGTALGFFSVPEFRSTEQIAPLLAEVEGPVLDVGCGVLPMPNYLKLATEPYGVDPYPGHGPRAFPFALAVGERLPFGDGHFAAALLMSSLDHVLDPVLVLFECWRVTHKGGLLVIWYEHKEKKDAYHPWTLTTERLLGWTAFGFQRIEQRSYPGGPGYARTDLMLSRRTT